MKTNGSVYVAVVLAVLAGYFGYQWWYNPTRAVKLRLGQVAEALSVPAGDTDLGRVARLAQLRRYLADDIHVRAGSAASELASRDRSARFGRGRRRQAAGTSRSRTSRSSWSRIRRPMRF